MVRRGRFIAAAGLFLLGTSAQLAIQQARADAPAASTKISVAFFDANPSYLNGQLPLSVDGAAAFVTAADKAPGREGLAADGVTQLILRIEVPQGGTVGLAWAGEEPSNTASDRQKKARQDVASAEDRPRRNATEGVPYSDRLKAGLHTIVEGDKLDRIVVHRSGEKHFAWALVTAPDEFGVEHAGKGSRELKLEITFTPAAGQPVKHAATMKLVRPPVVLVHGTYHGPKEGWGTRPTPDIGDKTMVEHLKERGFEVFLCDYEKSNGKRNGGPSHLRDNQKVVWENPGGIRDALESFRKRGLAVTQADVVGHSMGGTLARVYARGVPLPQPKKAAVDAVAGTEDRPTRSTGYPAGLPTEPTNWYLRDDNFQRGDIHRLITVCTPHFGSEIVHLVGLYPDCCGRVPPEIGQSPQAKALLQMIDLAHGTQTGAFFDQAPLSSALCAIGPTPVPCHAIAGAAEPDDFSQFHELYRWNFLTLYLNAAPELMEQLFTHEKVKQNEDAARLVGFLKDHKHLLNGMAARALAANLGRPQPKGTDKKLEQEYTQALSLFCRAVFRGQLHDGTVTQPSAHGGLARKECCSTLEGVVHSFASRYPKVQKRVSDLLEGPAENFDSVGFPAVGDVRDDLKPASR